MKQKRLLMCPNCLATKGKREVLGRLDDDGAFVVKRYQQHATTRIVSDEFEVQCGVCNEVCFFRKGKIIK